MMANASQTPSKPATPKICGVSTEAMTAPPLPQHPQIPVANAVFLGSTHCWMAMGPHVVMKVSEMPSIARDTMRTMPFSPESIPMREPMMMRPDDASMTRLKPKRSANPPAGSAKNIPTSVKIDMTQAAPSALSEKRGAIVISKVDALYCAHAADSPTASSTKPTTTALWYLRFTC